MQDVGVAETKAPDGGAVVPTAAAAAPNDAASMAATCMLAMAAQTMVTAAAAATAAAASSSSSAAAAADPPPAARSTPPPTHVVPSGPLHLSSMLTHFFQPEVLCGSNAYYCSRCAAKQTASKQLSVLTPAPQHLLICLKRNTYEFKHGQLVKNKIMKEVKYPCVLKLPVLEQQETEGGDAAAEEGEGQQERKGDATPRRRRNLWQTYVLYSVIVHSGTSAQRGHYYNISRQSDDEALAQLASLARVGQASPAQMGAESQSGEVDPELERLAQGGRWCQYNDSAVTPSSFAALADLTDTLPSDVAYLLFYRSVESLAAKGKEPGDAAAPAQAPAAASTSSLPGLDAALLKAVQADNHVYMQSLQQAAAVSAHRISPCPGSWKCAASGSFVC